MLIALFLIYAGLCCMWLWAERFDNYRKQGLSRSEAEDWSVAFWFFFCGWWILPTYFYFRWKYPEQYQ